jgi:hypothetical protein
MATKTHKEIKMTKPLIQINDEVREMTNEEFANYEIVQADTLARQAEAQVKAEAKSALLEKLGITEDEAKLLLA